MQRSYRKEIFTALDIHGKSADVNGVNTRRIADKAGIPLKKVLEEFADLDDLFYQYAIEYRKEHEKKSKKIIQLKGENALFTLVRHELSSIYYYLRDTPTLERNIPSNKTTAYSKDYLENDMYKYYFDVLRLNPELIPDTNMDIRVYAHFIVHSMFFCIMDINLDSDLETVKSMDPEEFKAPTRQIINALFKPKTKLAY
jgi:hypothetical protein